MACSRVEARNNRIVEFVL